MPGMLKQNIVYGLRTLLKSPGFTLTSVLTLALGIGATTAIFSVVYTTLFEPMPYPKPDQLVVVWSKTAEGRTQVSTADFFDWKKQSNSFQYLEAWSGGLINISTSDRPQQVEGSIMTPGFNTMTGSKMFLGRDFLPEDGEVGKDKVVILSNRLWSGHFGSNREIIGKPMRINGESHTVIGVTPPGYLDRLPFQLWVPLAFAPNDITREFHWMSVMGRLKDGVSIAQAQAEMDGIAQQLAREYPKTNANFGVSVEPLHLDFFPIEKQRNLWLLLGAVGFLLLIGCVNVANLMLARATTRNREVALRAALGASRLRIFGQLITESLIVSIAGGVLGVLLAMWLTRGIVMILPINILPAEADIRLSLPVLLFTLVLTMLTGLLFGSAPAWQASRMNLIEVLKQGGRTGSSGARSKARRVLVVAEFALALTLLAAGGLWLRSFWNLTQVDLGVNTERVLTFGVPGNFERLKDDAQVNAYYSQILERIQAVPGVEKAALTTGIPLTGFGFGRKVQIVGQQPRDASQQNASIVLATADYHETFGIRVTGGRKLSPQDTAGSQKVAMVNETFVKRFLNGVEPIGQRVLIPKLSRDDANPPLVEWQIVGVFHNVRLGELRGAEDAQVVIPFWQSPWPFTSVAVRTKGEPHSVTRDVAAAVNSVDPDLPIAGVKTMEEIRGEVLSIDRLGVMLFSAFAFLGLVLSAIGIYSVMAFAVSQRTQEFGVRLALGAQRSRVLSLVLKEGAMLAAIGSIVGLGGAYLMGRALRSTLYGVEAFDLHAFGAVAFVLLVAALLACLLPALRASKVDPIVALRAE
jgi:putative ABC transport system permease protein